MMEVGGIDMAGLVAKLSADRAFVGIEMPGCAQRLAFESNFSCDNVSARDPCRFFVNLHNSTISTPVHHHDSWLRQRHRDEGGTVVERGVRAQGAAVQGIRNHVQPHTGTHRSQGAASTTPRSLDAGLLSTHGQPARDRKAGSWSGQAEGRARDPAREGRGAQKDARQGSSQEG
ncbi:hypothetical protein L1887_57769 [Cichorium endivia]|nr:hypothetical protein L1887_57769 [Cichorium endivia]